MADRVVKEGITHVLTKMGIMGIRLKIAIKGAVPPEFELVSNFNESLSVENSKLTNEDNNLQESESNANSVAPKENVEKMQVREEVK